LLAGRMFQTLFDLFAGRLLVIYEWQGRKCIKLL
jgi:hypothetical protein